MPLKKVSLDLHGPPWAPWKEQHTLVSRNWLTSTRPCVVDDEFGVAIQGDDTGT